MDHAGEASWSWQTAADGLSLAVLIVLLTAAEVFDAARADIQSVAARTRPTTAAIVTPDALWWGWALVAVAGAVFACRVARRTVLIARKRRKAAIARARRQHTSARVERLPERPLWELARLSIGFWIVWQVLGIAVVLGAYGIPPRLVLALHVLAGVFAALAAGYAGAVIGSAGTALERAPLARLHVAVLLGLFIAVFHAGFVSDQLTDVLRGWGEGPLSRPLAGCAGALLLGAVIRASATRLLIPPTDLRGLGRLTQPLRLGPATTIVLGLAGVALVARGPRGAGAALLVLCLLATITAAEPPQAVCGEQRRGLRRLAGTLGVVPMGILLVGLTEASVNTLLLPAEFVDVVKALGWTVVAMVLFAALAADADVAAHHVRRSDEPVVAEVFGAWGFGAAILGVVSPFISAALLAALAVPLAARLLSERGAAELWAAWGVGLGLTVATLVEPVHVPRGLGGFAVTLLGTAAILAVLHPAGSFATHRRLRCEVRVRQLRIRHTPLVAGVAVWLLLAWLLGPTSRDEVRTVAAHGSPTTLTQAVGEWLDTQKPVNGYVPMLLVGASGGGSKAAYWTDLVLDCTFGTPPARRTRHADECAGSRRAPGRYARLFATSSVSGGSVGVYELVTHQAQIRRGSAWLDGSIGREVLSPLLAWGLFHDLPAFAAGLPTRNSACTDVLSCPIDADRATVQAGALAGNDGRSLLSQWWPLTIFNAAQVRRWNPIGVGSWRRVVLSRVKLAESRPGCVHPDAQPLTDAIDGHDLLPAGRDVTLATAAMLSARFPFLEPPGWLGTGADRVADCAAQPADARAKIRDGGTFENSGLLTLFELLPAIRRGIAAWRRRTGSKLDVHPIVVSIDDDVPSVDGDTEYGSRKFGLGDPGRRTAATRRSLNARCDQGSIVYLRISPVPHVGAQAATGWEVSETTRRADLLESLEAGREPGATLRTLQRLLDGSWQSVKCTRRD